jgi:hypothetical protein
VETPHASQTQSPPTSEAAAEPGNKDSEQFDAGTPARMFLLLGLMVGLSRQVVGPETSWEISVMAFIVGSILLSIGRSCSRELLEEMATQRQATTKLGFQHCGLYFHFVRLVYMYFSDLKHESDGSCPAPLCDFDWAPFNWHETNRDKRILLRIYLISWSVVV